MFRLPTVLAVLAVLALGCLPGGLSPTAADHSVFTVETRSDGVDTNPGDGVCSINAAGICSLRAAIQEANAHAGTDVVVLPDIGADGLADRFKLTLTSGATDGAFGDLDVTSDMTIRGIGAARTKIDGNQIENVLTIGEADHITVELQKLTVTGGMGNSAGGVSAVIGVLTVDRVAITANEANSASGAGGLEVLQFATVNVRDSTISQNEGSFGGGIGVFGGSLSIQNSTVDGNTAVDRGLGSFGGGLSMSAEGGTVVVRHTTIANNVAVNGAAISSSDPDPFSVDFTFANSVLTGNAADLCSGELRSRGNNIYNDASCPTVNSDRPSVNARLGNLKDNGGGTLTRAPLTGSPAIDKGGATCLPTDQRGVTRPRDGDGNGSQRCDSGAVERKSAGVP